MFCENKVDPKKINFFLMKHDIFTFLISKVISCPHGLYKYVLLCTNCTQLVIGKSAVPN